MKILFHIETVLDNSKAQGWASLIPRYFHRVDITHHLVLLKYGSEGQYSCCLRSPAGFSQLLEVVTAAPMKNAELLHLRVSATPPTLNERRKKGRSIQVLPSDVCLSTILFHENDHQRNFLDVLSYNKNNKNHAYRREGRER